MAVSFTSNIGLAKPDETEIAKKWVDLDNLQDDNNQILETKINTGYSFYTPSVIAATTPFNVGSDGVITAEYTDLQGFVWGRFRFIFGTTGVVAGSGEFAISLPALIDNTFHTVATSITAATGTASCLGEGYIRDGNVLANCGDVALEALTISGTSYVRLVTETFSGKTNRVFASGQPFTNAQDDSIAGNFFYKKA